MNDNDLANANSQVRVERIKKINLIYNTILKKLRRWGAMVPLGMSGKLKRQFLVHGHSPQLHILGGCRGDSQDSGRLDN